MKRATVLRVSHMKQSVTTGPMADPWKEWMGGKVWPALMRASGPAAISYGGETWHDNWHKPTPTAGASPPNSSP